MRKGNGFTLVELLVALTIFAMLAAAGVGLLSFSVRAQDVAGQRLKTLAEVRRAGALLTSDLAQATARVSRDEAGAARPALLGGTGQGGALVLALVRRGWGNLDDADRPSLQKVEYRLVGSRLERLAYPRVDGSPPLAAVPMLLFIFTLFWHNQKGVREVIDDYAHTESSRVLLITLLSFFVYGGGLFAAFCVLKIAFGGSSL